MKAQNKKHRHELKRKAERKAMRDFGVNSSTYEFRKKRLALKQFSFAGANIRKEMRKPFKAAAIRKAKKVLVKFYDKYLKPKKGTPQILDNVK